MYMPHDDFLVFVDFDSTLFSHQQFGGDWRRALAAEAHISRAQFDEEELALQSDPTKQYSVTLHLASHGVGRERIAAIFRDLCTQNNYLYPDAALFVQSVREASLEPTILTFGGQLFQNAKIEPNLARLAGNGRNLSYHVVDIAKGEYIASHVHGKRGVLIDDVADQNLPPGFTEIHLDRARQLDEPEKLESGYEVSNLNQVAWIVKLLFLGE